MDFIFLLFGLIKDASQLSMFYGTQQRPDQSVINPDGLLVIGAGLPRTGTTSLSEALAHLFNGSCFHGSRLPNFTEEEFDFWLRALGKTPSQEPPTVEEWRHIFRHDSACLDLPCILFYKQLMVAFPKVTK